MAKDDKAQGATPPEDGDKPVLTGGPGAESGQDDRPAGPKLVTVEYMGRKVQLPEDAAAVWQERESAMSRQGTELGELRTWRKTVEPRLVPPSDKPTEPDYDTQLFENPKAAIERLKREMRQEIVGEYRQDQALRTFWEGFYRSHDDLREDDWMVRAMFQEHFNELADLPTREAQTKLGEITRTQILRLTRKTKSPTDTTPRDLLEPASGDRPPRPAAQDDDGPQSIGSLIASRRAERNKPRSRSA